MGGEELDAFLWCLFVWFNSTRDTIERAILVRDFPLTPRPWSYATVISTSCEFAFIFFISW